MTTYISHPNIAWRVAVVCDDEIHTYLAALFSSFYVDRDVSGLLAPEKTLTLYKTEDGYRIKNTDVVCTDLILVNGTDIQTFEEEDYRRMIAAVLQDFSLFSLSIKDNIDLTDEKTDADAIASRQPLKTPDVQTYDKKGWYNESKGQKRGTR